MALAMVGDALVRHFWPGGGEEFVQRLPFMALAASMIPAWVPRTSIGPAPKSARDAPAAFYDQQSGAAGKSGGGG